jgi:hypothetical protein
MNSFRTGFPLRLSIYGRTFGYDVNGICNWRFNLDL